MSLSRLSSSGQMWVAHSLGIAPCGELGIGVVACVCVCVMVVTWRLCCFGVGWLIVGLEETNSSPILPKDSAAGFIGWDSGSAKAQVCGPSYGNTNSCTHKAADLRVGEVPLLS